MKMLLLISLSTLLSCQEISKKDGKFVQLEKMLKRIDAKFSEVPVKNVKDLLKNSGGYVFVDVRTPKERKISMLPGAIGREEFEAKAPLFKNKEIIVYCTIGYRSSQYVPKLLARGFKAFNLRGSALSWAWHGGKFQKNGIENKKLHVYGPRWDLLPEGYQGIYQ